MQKAIIVKDSSRDDRLNDINDFLQGGWKVVSMCPMPSSITGSMFSQIAPTCLVIIEKT